MIEPGCETAARDPTHDIAALDDEGRAEALRWAGIGIAALALAGVLALLLALARTPVIQDLLPWPWESFFPKALVSHVVLSVVVWFLAALGMLTTLASGSLDLGASPGGVGHVLGNALEHATGHATVIAGAACALLVGPALLDLGAPSLNNYVPVLDTPLYLAGLVLLALAVALPCLRLLSRLTLSALNRPLVAVSSAAALAYLSALVCFALGIWLTEPMADRRETFEFMFWGGGHVLQIVNALLLIAAWVALAGWAGLGPVLAPAPFTLAVGAPALVALGAPLIHLFADQSSGAAYRAFTDLYVLALAPTLAVLGLAMARRAWIDRHRLSPRDPMGAALLLSLALFGLGGLFGFLLGQGDTRTPAHYHAAIGGVNLALFGLFLALVPLLANKRRGTGKARWLLLWLYGAGQGLHSLGLFLAGTAGVARKTAGADQALDSAWKLASMGIMGLGGLIAVIGGVMFVILAGRDAWGSDIDKNKRNGKASAFREDAQSCRGDST
ncbi:MAG: cbb3-type cytochrome c oxidase subunit I [Rhodospirillum sp.]|nr:cbb3-type cytochrome c oxidase subunit I [Rhodospirillum sp.]MCF8489370.1 cbb3-type cytochrome c oxidase subunit I [Rhodospirillum sp.]